MIEKINLQQRPYAAILVKDIGWVKKPKYDYIYTYNRADTSLNSSSMWYLVGKQTFFYDSVLGFEEI